MDWDSSNSTTDFFTEIPTSEGTNTFQFHHSTAVTQNVLLQTSISSATSAATDGATNLLSSTTTDTNNQTLRIYPALTMFEDALDPKYVEKINSFWLEFNPPNPRTQYTIAILYILIYMIGCGGNALVIYMFLRCKSLRTPANILIMNLAISDFFMLSKCPIVIYNSFRLGPALGDWGCRVYGFVGGLTGTASITTLTAISIDRYNVVVYPLDPLRSTSKLRSRFTLIFIWSYSLIFSIIPALDIGLSNYVPEGFLTTCSFDYLSKSDQARLFMLIFFIAAWCLPFITIAYCYFYILKVVAIANSIQSSKDKNKTELKLTAIVIGVIMLWFIAWTPYAIVALFGITGNKEILTPLASMIPAIFCKISACIDPYIYAVTHPRFRMEFRRIFFGQNQRLLQRNSTFRSSNASRVPASRHRIAQPDNIKMETIGGVAGLPSAAAIAVATVAAPVTISSVPFSDDIHLNHHHHHNDDDIVDEIINELPSYQSDDLKYQNTDILGDIQPQIRSTRAVHSDDGKSTIISKSIADDIKPFTIEKAEF